MKGRDLTVGALAVAYATATGVNIGWTLWERSRPDGLRLSLIDTVPNQQTALILAAAVIVLATGAVGVWARRALMLGVLSAVVQWFIGLAGVATWLWGNHSQRRTPAGLGRVTAAILCVSAALGWLDRRRALSVGTDQP